jgi:hypothetical protein
MLKKIYSQGFGSKPLTFIVMQVIKTFNLKVYFFVKILKLSNPKTGDS